MADSFGNLQGQASKAESSAQAAIRAQLFSKSADMAEDSESKQVSDGEREEDDDDDGDDDMSRYAHVEQLAMGRAKRSTAGNRMRALLDQEDIEDDEMFVEVEGDNDFREKEDEHDVVDSDFDQESEDEAMEYDEEDQGERELEAQEKAQRKQRVARARAGPAQLKKFGIRQSTARPPPSALNPTHSELVVSESPTRQARASALRAPTTSGLRAPVSAAGRVRTSSRKATVKVKLETQSKLREAAERRAAQPTRYLPKKRPRLTQDALIAEALEMEEANRESLRAFLAQEEEKKRARNGTKPVIAGPFLRWTSTRHVDLQGPGIQLEAKSTTDEDHTQDLFAMKSPKGNLTEDPAIAARAEVERLRQIQASQGHKSANIDNQSHTDPTDVSARTYLSLHDLPRSTTWSDELTHIFGDHTEWVDLRIVPSRNRPLRPRRSTCAVTGLAANYKDPRTGIPYANKEAFAILTDLLEHRYVWGGSMEEEVRAINNYDLSSAEAASVRQNTPVGPPQHLASADSIGFYAGREDDPGAGGSLRRVKEQLELTAVEGDSVSGPVRTAASSLSTTTLSSKHSDATSFAGAGTRPSVTATLSAPIIIPSVAPGDEKVLIEAALALPSGTTRSGAKRAIPPAHSTTSK